jgi:hypothetical protein
MNVVVAGLSPRDAAAFGFFMSRSMKGWSWESTPAGRGTVLPKADLLVADLVSLGLAQWSEAAEAELLRVLQGSTAVLLVPSHDRTWASMDAGTVKQHALVWLAKPYGSEDMRKALETAAAVHRAVPPVRAPAAAPGTAAGGPAGLAAPAMAAEVPPRGPRPMVPAPALAATVPPVKPRPQVSVRSSVVVPPVAEDAAEEVPGLSTAQLQARLVALPEPGRHVFLRKLSAMLMMGRPFEARFTVQNSVIFHPADGWVASNTPMLVIERVGLSDALAAAVMIREIDGPQAEERAQRLGMPLRELDTFLWQLAAAALDKKTPPAGSRPF